MLKITASCLALAVALAGTVAPAQQVQPLDPNVSSQSLPVLANIPPGAIVAGGFVILAGIIIGMAGGGDDDDDSVVRTDFGG